MTGQRGGIITGFLFRMVIVFAVLGLVVFEAGAVIVANVAVDGIARDAAREAALRYDGSPGSADIAERECKQLAKRAGAVCLDLTVRSGFVTATVRKQASTLIAHKIGAVRSFTRPVAEHSAPIP